MFSRLYQSARALFTDIPKNEKIQPPAAVEPLRNETMVTTRQRNAQEPVEDEVNEENSINVYVPSTNKKRQKRAKSEGVVILSDDDDAEFTPPSSRKRKRLPVRAKDVESLDPGKTRPVVEIPARKVSPELDHGNASAAEGEVGDTKAEDEEQDVVVVQSLETSKHRRFGSDLAEDEFFSTAREVATDEVNATSKEIEDGRIVADSDDSEDDAPEAVGIQDAAKSVKLKERGAAKTVKDQLSASRKKRKERDDVLKKQAESSRKRKLEADIPSILNLSRSSIRQETLPNGDLNIGEDEDLPIADEGGAKNYRLLGMPLSSKRSLPDLLPAEYLEDIKPQESILFDEIPRKKAKKTKFLQSLEKVPKDRRIGSTTYRVTKGSSSNLAPKSSSQARHTKESWLQGRSGKKVGTDRKPLTKGFFKK